LKNKEGGQMYNVTPKYLSYFNDPLRVTEAKVEINDVTYGMDTIIDFNIEDSVISTDDFNVGGCVSSKLELSIKTDNLITNNAVIKPYVRYLVDGDPTEWIPLGIFKVDSRKKEYGVWNFTCFDQLIVSQKAYKSDLIFPNTMWQVLVELTYNLGITWSDDLDGMINLSYMIQTKPSDSFSYRDILRFIASAHGKVAKLNKLGQLAFINLSNKTPVYKIKKDLVVNSRELNPLKTITQLVFNMDSEEEPIVIGEGDIDNTIWIYNPFMTEDIALDIFDQINGTIYMPVSTKWVSSPHIEVGDLIEVETRASVVQTINLRSTLFFKGGISSTLESPSNTAQQSEYGFVGSIGQEISKIGQRIGVFAQAFNNSKMQFKQQLTTVAIIPLTTASETDIEFKLTASLSVTTPTILTVEFRASGVTIRRLFKVPLTTGINFIHVPMLVRRLPRISDWIMARMSVDVGTAIIEQQEAEFIIYGGNIISGQVEPLTDFEDTLTLGMFNLEIQDNLFVELVDMLEVLGSDTISNTAIQFVEEVSYEY
jgi:hypothetical protein